MSTARDEAIPHQAVPRFELRHRMALALEWAEVGKTDMAEHLGTHRNTVTNYLSGRTAAPVAVLRVWALRCGVPYRWLLDGADDGPDGTPDRGSSQSACNVHDLAQQRRHRVVTPHREDQAA